MAGFGRQERRDPIVLNLSQNVGVNKDRFLVGPLEGVEPNNEGKIARKVVKWRAMDARERERSKEIRRTSVMKGHHVEIGPNVISPRGVHVLFPDQFHEVPSKLRGDGWGGNDSALEGLGAFFGYLYQQQGAQQALEIALGAEAELPDKIRKLTRSSELDDQLRLQVEEAVNRAIERSNKAGSSSGSGSSS